MKWKDACTSSWTGANRVKPEERLPNGDPISSTSDPDSAVDVS